MEKNKKKSNGLNIVLPFNLQNISKEDAIKVALIWVLPCAIVWPLHRLNHFLGLKRKGILDDIPSLEPFFVLWLFFGWILPALYFKWKHKHNKEQ